MPTFAIPFSHGMGESPAVDTAADDAPKHVPFFRALETTALAYQEALSTYCQGLVTERHLALVNVNGDFRRELFTGPANFTVVLERIGASSLTFRVEIEQSGAAAASVQATLAQVDGERSHSVPFSAAQLQVLRDLQALTNSEIPKTVSRSSNSVTLGG